MQNDWGFRLTGIEIEPLLSKKIGLLSVYYYS